MLDLPLIKNINIDITNICPLECPLCLRQVRPVYLETAKEISLDDFQKIATFFDRIELIGALSDPIYHSKFEDILEMCIGKEVYISTAGQGKSRKWWENVFEITKYTKFTTWVFALDGLPEDSHKYRVKQNGPKVWETMKFAADYFRDVPNVNVVWQYIIFNYNEDTIEEAQQMAIDNNLIFKKVISQRWNSKAGQKLMPTKRENRIFNEL